MDVRPALGPPSSSVRVLVLAPGARLLVALLGRAFEERRVVRGYERIGRHDRVRVVNGPVLASEGDPAGALPQAVLQLRPDLLGPLLKPVGRILDHLLDLGNLLRLLLAHGEPEVP